MVENMSNKDWSLENITNSNRSYRQNISRGDVKVGLFAKLVFKITNSEADASAERMWVRVTSVDKDTFEGVLDNDPEYIRDIKDGDTITFKIENILEIGKF